MGIFSCLDWTVSYNSDGGKILWIGLSTSERQQRVETTRRRAAACGKRTSNGGFPATNRVRCRSQPDPEETLAASEAARQVSERSGRSERRLNANSSASAAGGLMEQSGSNVVVTCRLSVRRRRTAASPSCQLVLPTLTRRSLRRRLSGSFPR